MLKNLLATCSLFLASACLVAMDSSGNPENKKSTINKEFLWACRSKMYDNLSNAIKKKPDIAESSVMEILTELDLSHHRLENLDDFTKFFKVTCHIAHKEKVPQDILENITLKKLILHNNELKDITNWQFYQLDTLKVLDLRSNKLKVVPSGLFGLKKLKTLDISENKITELPEGLSALQKLRTFYFDRYCIRKMSDDLVNLPKLDDDSKQTLCFVMKRLEEAKKTEAIAEK